MAPLSGKAVLSNNRSDIRSLTGIRGVFACYVMFYHLANLTIGRGPVKVLIDHGYLSVDLFFVLSGFVLAMTYHGWFLDGLTLQTYRLFLWRRLARIYPLYFCMTIVFCAPALIGRHAWISLDDAPVLLAKNLAMIQAWGIASSLDPSAWSISTEWAAYLLFPVFMWAGLHSRWRVMVFAVGCCTTVLMLAIVPTGTLGLSRPHGPLDIGDGTTLWPLARCLALFGLGVVAWRLGQVKRVASVACANLPSAILAFVILLLLFVRGSDLAVALLCPFLIIGISTDKPVAARILGSTIIHWLGRVSYSIYLVHMLMFGVRERILAVAQTRIPAANLVVTTGLCVVAVGLAGLLYHWIEAPGRKVMNRWLATGRSKGGELTTRAFQGHEK